LACFKGFPKASLVSEVLFELGLPFVRIILTVAIFFFGTTFALLPAGLPSALAYLFLEASVLVSVSGFGRAAYAMPAFSKARLRRQLLGTRSIYNDLLSLHLNFVQR
jgi:hypothetical protein